MESLSEGFLVLSRILDVKSNALKGFLAVDTTGKLVTLNLDVLNKIDFPFNCKNAEYDKQYKTLVGIKGNSLVKYPSITEDIKLLTKDGIIVLATILDTKTKKPIGVVAYNGMGSKFNLTYSKLNDLTRKYSSCNFNMVNDKEYGLIAVQKDGSYFETIEMSIPAHPSKGVVQQSDPSSIPVIKAYSMDFIKDNEFSQPCQDKLVRTMLNMQALTPYYSTILQAIKRVPAPDLGTMGVTEDTLLYDMKFVANLQISELTFVLIHEIMHIAMQHSIRFGNRQNHELWNIACDLYINSIICNDFGCKFGGGTVELDVEGSRNKKVVIKTPDFGVYIETIGETIDLNIDTPETIYNKLLDENKDNSNGQGQGQSQNNQGQGQGQGQSQGQNQGGQGQGQGQNGEGQQEQGQNGQGQYGQSQDQSGQQGHDGNGQSSDLDDIKEVSVVYNGKKLKGSIMKDIMSNKEAKNNDDVKSNIEASRRALQQIDTKIKLEEKDLGCSLTKNAGQGCGLIKRYIEIGLSAGVDWRVLLRNMCKDKPKKTFTLSQPNQDYMNMGMTIADRRAIGKPTHIANVKFAIDVSGSVSEQELKIMLSEINNIYRYYKVDGELIYWSTMVGNAGMFSSLKDMLKIEPVTTGGTDVRCVFEYLSGETKVNKKAEPDRVRDIKGVFIITDGYFSMNFDDYAKYFGRKVVWLITGKKGNPITFNPPFGRVIGLDI